MRSVNLASQPFENLRGLRRVKWGLLLIGALAWALAGIKFWDYAAGSSEETREQLATVDAEIAALRTQLDAKVDSIRRADLEERNQRVTFLNTKLAERAFPWSRLFQDLSQVQPDGVRLHRLAPQVQSNRDGIVPAHVELTLEGVSRQRETWYQFVDQLFEHPRFFAPDMGSERERDNVTEFRMQVFYRTELEAGSVKEASQE